MDTQNNKSDNPRTNEALVADIHVEQECVEASLPKVSVPMVNCDGFNEIAESVAAMPSIHVTEMETDMNFEDSKKFEVSNLAAPDKSFSEIDMNITRGDSAPLEKELYGLETHPVEPYVVQKYEKEEEDREEEESSNTFLSVVGQKRRNISEDDDESPDLKKFSNASSEEKKIVNLRKNIRDVMDENQLDTNTLVAQREESERLARVAEQQKIIREYQRQTAVNRQFVRTQNRVLSLLQSGNTFAKITDLTTEEGPLKEISPSSSEYCIDKTTMPETASGITETKEETEEEEEEEDEEEEIKTKIGDISTKLPCLLADDKNKADIAKKSSEELKAAEMSPVHSGGLKQPPIKPDVVTIEDSSSEDDCILLSDDDEEELEEETEDDPHNSGLHVKDAYNVPDELGRVVVNIGHPEGEEDIFIAPQIAKTIKPHQIGGVRFLFDNIIESTKRFKNSSGFGCILAHSMGLGKTLQVVCFCDIFLRHTLSKTVLCVMPINTLQNWVSEFNMWTPKTSNDPEQLRPRQFDVFVLNDQQKTLTARAKVILKWAEEGGVLLIGYELFRLLALKLIPTRKRRSKNPHSETSITESNKRLMESMHQALVKPGPDLVICDEGHRIKNAHAGISLALKQIRTRRRIVLTGYPLQNNLLEYWCMVDFVRPNYLGNRTEFCNMFERPIQNGQCIDSTPEDCKLMRYRAHVLHSLLVGFVQRRSHVVLQQTLPQKLEYVILTRMTPFQRQLYDTFMNDVVRSKTVPNPLKAFAVCCKIWNHPDVLYNFLKKRETDLDLEIDENEVVSELTTPVGSADLIAAAATTISNTNPTEPNPAPQNFTEKLQSPCEVKEESSSSLQQINSASSTSTKLEQTLNYDIESKDAIANRSNPSTENVSVNRSYDNMFYSENYYQHNNVMSYPSDGNNYWQEPSVPYFGFHPVSSNIGFSSKPDYVGIMVKNACEPSANDSENVNTSSEIVDLDTKEIRTVQTVIDMNQNSLMKSESSSDVKQLTLFEKKESITKEETAADDKEKNANILPPSPDSSKVLSNTSASVSEKEPPKVKGDDGIPYEWAVDLMKKYESELISNSSKMEIFFCILNESIKLGDRVLLFSQSLLTLNLIEQFLQLNHLPDGVTCWVRNVSYCRLDGSTTSQEREKLVNEFNSNSNVKLFLISTRAGSLGINLVGANRVIVFDASWNPCHDTQAVYRIYRYGQKKACFVYRIVMDKCLEKKIYDRQIKKQGMSDRVVDECNPDAHLSMKDVTNLCHDYDDDDKNKHNAEAFVQPIDSYVDTIIQKIVEHHKTSLSKEPFHHESLLIDRKEKKLSQAEKRQAHRGYEMEKKASIKQTLTCSTNKIQYRIVRNDGTVVTRPVASIRPMQTTKTQNLAKAGSIRSTRWIPAEVWQRQGMTAQEMTLPLDVVIPTNSNDKSNIILKAGQRVMVLKSAKGIYMQLDSGKIIAIRTSSKTSEASKVEKGEVIDITSEGDGASDAKNGLSKQSTLKPNENTDTETETKSQNVDNKGSIKYSAKPNISNEIQTKDFEKVTQKPKESQQTNNIPHIVKTVNPQKPDQNNEKFSQNKINTLSHMKKCSTMNFPLSTKGNSESKTTIGQLVKKKIPQTTFKNTPSSSSTTPQQHILMGQSTQKVQSPMLQQMKTISERINNKSVFKREEKEVKRSIPDFSHNHSKDNPFVAKTTTTTTTTKRDDASVDRNTEGILSSGPQENEASQSSKMLAYSIPENYASTVKVNKPKPNLIAPPPTSNSYFNATATRPFPATTQKDKKLSAPECLQKTSNSNSKLNEENKSQILPTDYLQSQAQQYGHSNLVESSQMSQYSLHQQQSPQQHHPKLHIYMPHYNMPHPQFSNSTVPPSNTSVPQSMNTESNLPNTFLSNRDVPNYSQYYDNMYDSNMSATCEYPTQFADYPAYGSYNHPHYHSSFHTNTYGSASSPPVASNPYHHIPWSPLVTPAPVSEQCSTIYPSTFSQNGAQSNQWHP